MNLAIRDIRHGLFRFVLTCFGQVTRHRGPSDFARAPATLVATWPILLTYC